MIGPVRIFCEWSTPRADLSVDTQNSLDPITVDPNAGFDIHKTSDLASAKNLKESAQRAIDPDLIIGNPPYGVKVVKAAGYDAIYDLQSKDSYGYFIANALARLEACTISMEQPYLDRRFG